MKKIGAISGRENKNLIKGEERGDNIYYVNYLGFLRGDSVSHKGNYVN